MGESRDRKGGRWVAFLIEIRAVSLIFPGSVPNFPEFPFGDGSPDMIENGMRFMPELYGHPGFFEDFPTAVFHGEASSPR